MSREISENIERTQKIIKAVDMTLTELEKGCEGLIMTAPVKAWNELIFGRADKLEFFNQAKLNTEEIKILIGDLIDMLKSISNQIPEYKFNDYGIEKEFIDFYDSFNKIDVRKLKNYRIEEDVEKLTDVSAKAARIKSDLIDLIDIHVKLI